MSIVGTRNQDTRDEWLAQTLKKIPPGSKILDAGAGEQQYKNYCSHLDYVSQDFGKYDGKGNGAAFHVGKWDLNDIDIISDISSIPEQDASFDAIMCTEVFEHLSEPIKAVKEFARLLKPNGHLIITAPFCSLTHFSPYHYYTGFNKYFYETFLRKYGFQIIELEPNGNFFEYLAQEIRRIRPVTEKYGNKRGISHLDSFLSRFTLNRILSILERLSDEDRGSHELLSFGYHIHAIKKQST